MLTGVEERGNSIQDLQKEVILYWDKADEMQSEVFKYAYPNGQAPLDSDSSEEDPSESDSNPNVPKPDLTLAYQRKSFDEFKATANQTSLLAVIDMLLLQTNTALVSAPSKKVTTFMLERHQDIVHIMLLILISHSSRQVSNKVCAIILNLIKLD